MSAEKQYSVNLWGSHPDKNNDDCHTGEGFATLAGARACLARPWETFAESYYGGYTAFFELDGPDVHEVHANPAYSLKVAARRRAQDESEARSEHAFQAGMGLGVEAFNDAMGYGA